MGSLRVRGPVARAGRVVPPLLSRRRPRSGVQGRPPGTPFLCFRRPRHPRSTPGERRPPGSSVRIQGRRPRFSTVFRPTGCPHPGDCEFVQTLSTGEPVDSPSGEVRGMWICGRRGSTACGQTIHPQGRLPVVHRPPTGRPVLYTAFPHPRPLFGNATPRITAPSERRHTKLPGWAVGNLGKPGDSAGEKWTPPVHGVCRTFRGPQKSLLFHRAHPQPRWTKNPG
jgi:hypothetical protein